MDGNSGAAAKLPDEQELERILGEGATPAPAPEQIVTEEAGKTAEVAETHSEQPGAVAEGSEFAQGVSLSADEVARLEAQLAGGEQTVAPASEEAAGGVGEAAPVTQEKLSKGDGKLLPKVVTALTAAIAGNLEHEILGHNELSLEEAQYLFGQISMKVDAKNLEWASKMFRAARDHVKAGVAPVAPVVEVAPAKAAKGAKAPKPAKAAKEPKAAPEKREPKVEPAPVFPVKASGYKIEDRAQKVPLPEQFFLEADPKAAARKGAVHQVDPSRVQGCAPVMPNLELATGPTGNPYPVEADDTVVTADRYKPFVRISHETFKVLSERGELRGRPDDETVKAILAAAKVEASADSKTCIQDTLRDLALYGLAEQSLIDGRVRTFKKV